ncbi:MAG: hypothetical protein ACJ72R_00060 [Nitrososphaeraceae archaeon]
MAHKGFNQFGYAIPAQPSQGVHREYVTEHLPEQYQVCLTALDAIIKRAFEILESSPDNREKLQAIETIQGYSSGEARATVECYNH